MKLSTTTGIEPNGDVVCDWLSIPSRSTSRQLSVALIATGDGLASLDGTFVDDAWVGLEIAWSRTSDNLKPEIAHRLSVDGLRADSFRRSLSDGVQPISTMLSARGEISVLVSFGQPDLRKSEFIEFLSGSEGDEQRHRFRFATFQGGGFELVARGNLAQVDSRLVSLSVRRDEPLVEAVRDDKIGPMLLTALGSGVSLHELEQLDSRGKGFIGIARRAVASLEGATREFSESGDDIGALVAETFANRIENDFIA